MIAALTIVIAVLLCSADSASRLAGVEFLMVMDLTAGYASHRERVTAVATRRNRLALAYGLRLTAFVAVAGVGVQLVLIARGNAVLETAGAQPHVITRTIRLLSYFTVESNIGVAVAATAVALAPDRDGRVFRVLRLSALFGITVTGVVYSVLIAPIHHPTGLDALANAALHYATPVMAIVGWLVFGPRPRIDQNTLIWSLAWPSAYIAYTVAHGAATHRYPYHFIDVAHLGYATALRNGVGMVVLMIGVGALYGWLDNRLSE